MRQTAVDHSWARPQEVETRPTQQRFFTAATFVNVAPPPPLPLLPLSTSGLRSYGQRLVTLLERVPLSLVDRERLLPLAEKSGFFRAAVILLKAVRAAKRVGFDVKAV